MSKILHLTLKKKWFDLISSGEKKTEYREMKPYWKKRLEGREFTEIHFKNGYSKDAPFMRIECEGMIKNQEFMGKRCYALILGEILEKKQMGR